MRYNRDRIDIISQILNVAANGDDATKTKIMYSAFLSHTQLKECLAILTENGLLDHDHLRQTYKTTEKGLRFLGTYNQLRDAMNMPSSSSRSSSSFLQYQYKDNTSKPRITQRAL